MSRNVPEYTRLEIKYVAPEAALHQLKLWLRLHAAGIYSPYRPRWVNNVYFDDPNLFAYQENLSGVSARRKVRYRWYGQHDLPSPGALEIKSKRNYFGWKHSYKVPDLYCDKHERWSEIRKKIASQLEPSAKIMFDANPIPVLINRYHREYYVTHDQKIRVTIDTQQKVFDQRYKSVPNTIHAANYPATLVLEIKFARKDTALGSSFMQGLPIRVSRNSKYMLGVKSIHDH